MARESTSPAINTDISHSHKTLTPWYAHAHKTPCLEWPHQKQRKETEKGEEQHLLCFLQKWLLETTAAPSPRPAGTRLIVDIPHSTRRGLTSLENNRSACSLGGLPLREPQFGLLFIQRALCLPKRGFLASRAAERRLSFVRAHNVSFV